MAGKVKEVKARVLNVKGECSLGYKAGDIIRFTEGGVDGNVCIHVMHSMLPKVFAMMFNAGFPWAQNPMSSLTPARTRPTPSSSNSRGYTRNNSSRRQPERLDGVMADLSVRF